MNLKSNRVDNPILKAKYGRKIRIRCVPQSLSWESRRKAEMSSGAKAFFWGAAGWSMVASVLNVIEVIWLPSSRIGFAAGMAGFLFCLFGHLAFIVTALILGRQYKLKRWPLWFSFLHPIFGLAAFSFQNWPVLAIRREDT